MAVKTSKNLRNKVIYQIFTRNYKEGTFKAIEADLQRIKDLGVDIIYLLPIHPNGEINRKGSIGSPYAVKDYREIDPRQGTMEDFVHLTEAIHALGMQVMLDLVYNHTSPDSWLVFNNPEWFYRRENGRFGNKIGDWWDVIDLDYSKKGLWEYQIETMKIWANYVDGFRCAVAPLVPLEFWLKARKEIDKVRPDLIWLAESIEPHFVRDCRKSGIYAASDSEMYQAFDICYDYDIYKYQSGALRGDYTLGYYLHHVNLQEAIYPDNYSKLRCLENHDRPRAAAMIPDEQLRRNWTAWIYFAKGTTMIYAGQEYCDSHHPTLFDSDPIIFDEKKDISPLMSKLAEIKKAPVFAYSSFEAKAIGNGGNVIYAKYEGDSDAPIEMQTVVGIFSTTNMKQSLKVEIPDGYYTNAITGEQIHVFENTVTCNAEPIIIFL